MKIQAEIRFMKTCKVEHLTSTFANVKLATWPRNKKLKMKISCIIIETELQHNHCEKRKTQKEIKNINIILKTLLNITFITVINFLNKNKFRAIAKSQQKKLNKFRYK